MAPEHVLVVVGEWELRVICHDALVAAGYRVTTSETADAARYVLKSSEPPDAVLLCTTEPWAEALRDAIERVTPRPVVTFVGALEDNERRDPQAISAAVAMALAQAAAIT